MFLINFFSTIFYIVNLPNFVVLHTPLGNPQDYILDRNKNNNHPFPLEIYKMENSGA